MSPERYAVALVLAAVASCSQAPPPPQPAALRDEDTARHTYEMEERCGRTAREWFKQFFGNGTESAAGSRTDSGLESHYNPKMNKCFALVSITATTTIQGKASLAFSKTLVDVNENHELGTMYRFIDPPHVMQCTLAGRDCTNEDAWDALAKPYMER